MRGIDAIGQPAQIEEFDVLDELIQAGGGVTEDAQGEQDALGRGEICPGPIEPCESFFADVFFQPEIIGSAFHILRPVLQAAAGLLRG